MSYTGRAYDEVNDVIPRSDVRGVEKPYRDDRYDPRYPDSGDYSRPRDGDRSSRPKYDDDKPYRNNYDSSPYQSDRNPYSEERGDRKPYSDDRGDRKPYSDDRGDRKPYSDDRGDRKPYPNDSKSDRDPYKDRTSPKRDPYERKSYPEDKYDRKRTDPEDPYNSRSRPEERYDTRSYPEDPYNRKPHSEDVYSKPHQGVKPVDTQYPKEKRKSTSPDRHSPYRSDVYPSERSDQKKNPDSTHRSHPDEVRGHSPSHDKKKDKPVQDGYKPLDDLERKLHQPHPDEGLGYDHTRYDHKPHKDIKPLDDPVRGYNDPRYDVSPVTHRDVSPKLHKPISDRLVGDRDVVDYSPRVGVHVSPNPRLIDSPKYDRAPGHESRGPAKYGKPESESVNDLHIHVMPPEVWALNMPDANSQLVSEAIPVGRVRADPSDDLYDARKEIIRQLGHDNIPRDFIFLRTIGTVLTQVTPKQERELKIKHFIPPQTYGSDLYVVDSTALSKQHSGPPTHRMPPLPAIPNSDSHRYRLDDNERKRKDEEDKKRRHEEDKQRRREMEEEKRRRQEDDKRLTYDEIEEKLRLKQRDEEERSRQWKSEEHDRLRKRMGERPRTPTPPQRMDTNERESEKDRIVRDLHRLRDRTERADAEKEELLRRARRLQQKNEDRKNHTRDIWKKKYFEEKKRTAPREEHCANLKQEMEGVNRKIIGQMETTKDTGKRDREQKEKADMTIQTTRLEQDIEELQIRLQNIKMKLTAETKLRNQSECELQVLRSELAQKKAKSLGTHNLNPDLGIQTARRPPPALIRPPTPQYQRDRYDSDRERYDRKSPDSEKENKFHLKMGPVHVETEKPHYDEYRQPERPVEKKEHHEKPVEKREPDRKEPKPVKKDSDSESKPNKKPDKENPKPRPYNQKEFEEAFHTFATKANGTQATTKDIIKWSTDAGILGKHLNSNHIDIAYFKIKPKESKTIGLKEMHPLIEEMAVKYKEDRNTDHETAKKELLEKFTYAAYKLHGTTNAVKTGGVDRLTDTKKYTGSHKERFDANGKGKGKAGRENIVENSGYVGGFKNKGTYDKTH